MKPVGMNMQEPLAKLAASIERYQKILPEYEKNMRLLPKRIVIRDYVNDNKLTDRYLRTPLKQRAELVKIQAGILERIEKEMKTDSFKQKNIISKGIKIGSMLIKGVFETEKARKRLLVKA